MAHLWEDLRAQYRPLALYLVLEAGALLSWAAMRSMGFSRHRLGWVPRWGGGGGFISGRRRRAPPAPGWV
jgi:hypothetical protein